MDVLESDFLRASMPELFPIQLDSARNFALLERFEFEGSLIHLLLQGTCTEKIVSNETEARATAQDVLRETMPRSDGGLWAFRMNDQKWSAATRDATLWAACFVYAPHDKTWWFMGFADNY